MGRSVLVEEFSSDRVLEVLVRRFVFHTGENGHPVSDVWTKLFGQDHRRGEATKSQRAAFISLDEINKERGLGFGGDGLISPEERRATHEIALAQLETYMESGVNIVLDDNQLLPIPARSLS